MRVEKTPRLTRVSNTRTHNEKHYPPAYNQRVRLRWISSKLLVNCFCNLKCLFQIDLWKFPGSERGVYPAFMLV